MSKKNNILILDFGSQYTQLIARRIRELGVYCEIMPYNVDNAIIDDFCPQGIILSGGPASVCETGTPRTPTRVFELNCPVLGICYGMQTMAHQLGGQVASSSHREFGAALIHATKNSLLLPEGSESVWMSHQDHVVALPPGFEIIASSASLSIAAMADDVRRFYGLQFHPEVSHTKEGVQILKRFVHDICGCAPTWDAQSMVAELSASIVKQVAHEQVILGLSGGVDSSVVAALLHRTIGKNLTCIFVDHGFLRRGEKEQVLQTFKDHLGIEIYCVQVAELFFKALQDISDPEQKRKIIGHEFVRAFEQTMSVFPNAQWLAQGTIYPDVIESAGNVNSKAQVIKSHHNVAGLPKNMKLKVLEPLRLLFKDEVRKLGAKLGLPHDLLYRHPFPGPGLALRVLGEVSPSSIELVRQADYIFIEELKKHELYYQVSQAFSVLLPVNSVGVMGDTRKYAPVLALRAVISSDFMTAQAAALPWDFLENTANRIINEVHGLSRVVYDISGKPPATIEWE